MPAIITLNGIALDRSMLWQERFNTPATAYSLKYTLGGRAISRIGSTKQKNITLVGDENSGWLTKETVDQLLALAANPAGVYNFVFGDETFSVVFRYEDQPVIEMRPFVPRVLHEPGDYFTGTIKLRKVGG